MNFKNLFGFSRTKATDKSHIKNLTEMAQCDCHVAAEEHYLLQTIAKTLGISLAQVDGIQKNLSAVEFEIPADSRSKFHQLYDLVQMMLADKVLHVEEMKLCYQLVSKFGYPPHSATELIKLITTNIQNGQGQDETMQRVTFALKF